MRIRLLTACVLLAMATAAVHSKGNSNTAAVFAYEPDVVVDTFAGNGLAGVVDGHKSQARLANPQRIRGVSWNTLFIIDGTRALRRIGSDGMVETMCSLPAGDAPPKQYPDGLGPPRAQDVLATSNLLFTQPGRIMYASDGDAFLVRGALDPNASIFGRALWIEKLSDWDILIFDSENHVVYRTDRDRLIVFAGKPQLAGVKESPEARLTSPQFPLRVNTGWLFYDPTNGLTRHLSFEGFVTTVETNAAPVRAVDTAGNQFFIDGHRVLKRNALSKVTTIVAGSTDTGFRDGFGINARFNTIRDLVFFGDALFVADAFNHRIRRIRFSLSPETNEVPVLASRCFSGVVIDGIIGNTYEIQMSPTLSPASWNKWARITLPQSPYLWVDTNSPGIARAFYRAVLVP